MHWGCRNDRVAKGESEELQKPYEETLLYDILLHLDLLLVAKGAIPKHGIRIIFAFLKDYCSLDNKFVVGRRKIGKTTN